MGTDKRARQKANRQAKLAQQEVEEKTENRVVNTRRYGMIGAAVVAVLVLIFLFSQCGGDDNSGADVFIQPTPGPEVDDAGTENNLADSVPDDFEAFAGAGALASVEPTARNGAYNDPPAMTIDPELSYVAALNTDVGIIRLNLYTDTAPITVNNFVNLARDGYYDGTNFHRVIPGFMAQAGDPSGNGTGGPGYSFEDEIVDTRLFDRRGLLAMANSGPATNGSQFFITLDATDWLDGGHTIFGEIVGDDTILDRIAQGEPPITPTIINSIQIVEG